MAKAKRGPSRGAKVGRIEIQSPIYGTLALLHAETGVEVAAGERICEIEAMKTFISVETADSGTLEWAVELGSVVGEDDVLAWITPVGEK